MDMPFHLYVQMYNCGPHMDRTVFSNDVPENPRLLQNLSRIYQWQIGFPEIQFIHSHQSPLVIMQLQQDVRCVLGHSLCIRVGT